MINGWRTIATTSAAQKLSYCNQCGECCRRSPCAVMPQDVSRIASHLGIGPGEFLRRHTTVTEDGGRYRVAMRGCKFLEGNMCGIESVKPISARNFECWDLTDEKYRWTGNRLRRAARGH